MAGYWLGKHLSEEHKEKLRKAHTGQHNSPSTEFKPGCSPWNKGLSLAFSRARLNHGHLRVEYSLPSLSNLQLGYIAGILDGEGSISFEKRYKRKDDSFLYVISISIGQKTPLLLRTIKKWLNLPNNLQLRNNGMWYLEFNAQNQVKTILKVLQPLLIVKREQAQRALAYLGRKVN